MGKTLYPDTNCQYAFKTDRIGFLKRIKDKAETLWMDGYRAMVDPDRQPNVFLVWNENEGLACGYKVDAAKGVCTCKFFTDQYQFPLDPNDPSKLIPCKHLRGLKTLVDEEIAYFKRLEETARAHAYNAGSRDRADHYCVQWSLLGTAWTAAMAARYRQRAA